MIINDLSDHFATFYIVHKKDQDKHSQSNSPNSTYDMSSKNKSKFKALLENVDWGPLVQNLFTESAFSNFFQTHIKVS